MIKIALLGNPNCGKTTIFNSLTGSTQYVGNWPGVTVEKKEGNYKKNTVIIDLPGIYSLSPYTLEEVVTRDCLINDAPDGILNIVDATNIERNLYLTTQLIEIGIPVVVALNMYDIVDKSGDKIDIRRLQEGLGVPVIAASALKGRGIKEAANKIIELSKKSQAPISKIFSKKINDILVEITDLLESFVPEKLSYWYAVKFFERDFKATASINLPPDIRNKIETKIIEAENALDDTSESLIIFERYEYIEKIVNQAVVKSNKTNISERIDLILTNKFLALPFFALIMWLVYYISVSSVGATLTNWTNEVLFGEIISKNVSAFLDFGKVSPLLHGFIIDGLIGGAGSVLGFVPQIMTLFFLLSLLEDCGYMARAAFIMDRVFRKFGLSGKSFIPILIASGCAVPGIMATRTIENERDRQMTIILTPFIPCGAKLPLIALMSGAIFHSSSLIAPCMYFLGILAIALSGLILKKTRPFAGTYSPFVMELPQYHIPSLKNVLLYTWDRSRSFIVRAGTLIFTACGFIWILSNLDFNLKMTSTENSILAIVGSFISPIFKPLGFGNWQAAVASLTGLFAKENIVGTLWVFYGSSVEDATSVASAISSDFTTVSAISFMAFNLLCAPCVAAMAAIHREAGGLLRMFKIIGYQTMFAYCIALIINNLGGIIFLSEQITIWTFISLFVLGLGIWLLVRKMPVSEMISIDI